MSLEDEALKEQEFLWTLARRMAKYDTIKEVLKAREEGELDAYLEWQTPKTLEAWDEWNKSNDVEYWRSKYSED